MEPSYPFAIQSQDADDALALNREMEEYLSSRGDIYEKADGQINRREVIDKLTAIMVEWAGSIGRGKGIDEAVCQSGGGIHLRIFGSTRLGVHTPDADVDVLCVAPSFVLRSDFFNSFCLAMKNRVDVSMLSAVPEAYTPVVKFNIDGQAVDMIFVSLALTSIPSDLDILDSRHLKGLDEQGIRSLNGSRVAEWICRLVPNFSNFATALRFVKHWARQRGLYSNVLGFLGGVNYAILVAFVCQKYPYACAATIVRKFFQTYNQWRWPEPIMLVPTVEDPDPSETEGLYLPVWNPKVFPKDGLHAMPIITPAYPAMNSSYNVGVPQLRLIQDEITRGLIMFQQHRSGGGEKEPPFPWRSLCSPAVVDFFTRHPRYIQIDISAYSADDHRSWFGWCESRLRLLILALEQPPLTFCHPQANCFHRRLPLPPQQHPPNVPAFDLSGGVGGGAVAGDRISRSLSDGDLVHACSSSSGAGGSSSSSSSSSGSSSSSAGSGNHGVRSGSAPRVGVSDAATSTTPSSSPGGSGSPVTTSDGSGCHDSGAAESAAQASSSVSVESKRGDPSVSFAPLPSVAGGTYYVSTFFIGLSFRKDSKEASVSYAVNDFIHRVCSWEGRKPSMEIAVHARRPKEVPDFVYETKAEPSSMRACTPAKTNKNVGGDEAEIETRRRSSSNGELAAGRRLEETFDDVAAPGGGGGGGGGSPAVDDGIVGSGSGGGSEAEAVAVSPGGAFSSLASISEALSEPDMVAVGDGIPANGDPVPVPVPFPGGGGGGGGGMPYPRYGMPRHPPPPHPMHMYYGPFGPPMYPPGHRSDSPSPVMNSSAGASYDENDGPVGVYVGVEGAEGAPYSMPPRGLMLGPPTGQQHVISVRRFEERTRKGTHQHGRDRDQDRDRDRDRDRGGNNRAASSSSVHTALGPNGQHWPPHAHPAHHQFQNPHAFQHQQQQQQQRQQQHQHQPQQHHQPQHHQPHHAPRPMRTTHNGFPGGNGNGNGHIHGNGHGNSSGSHRGGERFGHANVQHFQHHPVAPALTAPTPPVLSPPSPPTTAAPPAAPTAATAPSSSATATPHDASSADASSGSDGHGSSAASSDGGAVGNDGVSERTRARPPAPILVQGGYALALMNGNSGSFSAPTRAASAPLPMKRGAVHGNGSSSSGNGGSGNGLGNGSRHGNNNSNSSSGTQTFHRASSDRSNDRANERSERTHDRANGSGRGGHHTHSSRSDTHERNGIGTTSERRPTRSNSSSAAPSYFSGKHYPPLSVGAGGPAHDAPAPADAAEAAAAATPAPVWKSLVLPQKRPHASKDASSSPDEQQNSQNKAVDHNSERDGPDANAGVAR